MHNSILSAQEANQGTVQEKDGVHCVPHCVVQPWACSVGIGPWLCLVWLMGQLEPAVPAGQDVVWLCLNFLHCDMGGG